MAEKQIDPQGSQTAATLRVVGPIIFLIGLLFMIIGIANFFIAVGRSEPPQYFWCFFVGMPLLFVGGVMSQFGYMGKLGRYVAGQSAPVAKDTFNYLADGTSGGVKKMAQAVGQGLSEGLNPAHESAVRCPKCGAENEADARFCNNCGEAITAEKICPHCGEENPQAAKFCDGCGAKI